MPCCYFWEKFALNAAGDALIINSSYNFIFIHIPKTGGTSMSVALAPLNQWNDLELGGTPFGQQVDRFYRGRFGIGKHSGATEARRVLGPPAWSKFYKFALSRNPYTRAISTYTFLKQRKENKVFMEKYEDVNAFILSRDFASPIMEGLLHPQRDWVCSPGGALLVDDVIPLETIDDGFPRILRRCGVHPAHAERLSFAAENTSAVKVPVATVSDAAIARIAERYEADFKLFGYSLDFADRREPPTPLG